VGSRSPKESGNGLDNPLALTQNAASYPGLGRLAKIRPELLESAPRDKTTATPKSASV
jgi:hypothetical protein